MVDVLLVRAFALCTCGEIVSDFRFVVGVETIPYRGGTPFILLAPLRTVCGNSKIRTEQKWRHIGGATGLRSQKMETEWTGSQFIRRETSLMCLGRQL